MNKLITISIILSVCTVWAFQLDNQVHTASKSMRGKVCSQSKLRVNLENTILVISNNQFFKEYPNVNSCHIGQIQVTNPTVDLKMIDSKTNAESLNFIHDKKQDFAYELYNGNFLIVLTQTKF